MMLNAVLEAAQDAIILTDKDLTITTFNPAAERMFGCPADNLVGKSVHELFVPERMVPQVRAGLDTYKATGRGPMIGSLVETRAKRLNGEEFPIEMTISPCEMGFVAVVRDITERKKHEERLARVTTQLHSVVDGMAAAVCHLDRDYKYLWASKPYCDWLRKSPEEVIGRPIRDIIGDEAFNILRPLWEKAIHGEQVEYEQEINIANIGPRWVVGRYTPTKEGWVAVLQDFTERKHEADQLAEVTAQLHTVVDGMAACVIHFSRDFKVLWCSKPYGCWLKRPVEDIIGKSIIEVFGQEIFDKLLPKFQKVLAGEHVNYEDELDIPGIGKRWVNGLYTPVKDGWVSLCLDLTEHRQLVEELSEADRRKDEFLAILSHELRNPLAPILSSLQVTRMRDGDCDPVVRDHRQLIERQVQHISRLLDDLLDVARISRGKLQLQRKPVQLQQAIARAIEQSRPNLDMRYHALTINVPVMAVWVEGDLARLEQVFTNLLNNAAKYTEACGKIRIDMESDEREAIVSITDTGIGISEQMLGKVFDLFAQAERRGQNHVTGSMGGLGVGLSLVKQIVEMHAGSVNAHSPGLNLGSTFTVKLPVINGREERVAMPEPITPRRTREEPATVPTAPSKDCRILVVDDNVDAADSFVAMLRMQGYDVWVANDGPAAIKSANEFDPDVVLLDIGLPYMDGFKVCRELRRLVPQAVIIAVTGLASEKHRMLASEAGFHEYLVKPVIPGVLEDLFRKHSKVEIG